jgi:signal recognition particle receptor subunit beta
MKNVKVVFFGRGEAGKSSLISKIIPDALNIEHKGMTVAMDFGIQSIKILNSISSALPARTDGKK